MTKYLPAIFILLFYTAVSFSAEKKHKVVLHLNDPPKFSILVSYVQNLKNKFGDEVHTVVIINGPAITRLADFSNTGEQVNKMLDAGAVIGACSMAMLKNNVKNENLIDGVMFLEEGGLARIVELQEQGYLYVKI